MVTLAEALVACCKSTGWTPKQVGELTIAQVLPFVTGDSKPASMGEALEMVADYQSEITSRAKRELELCRG